MIFLKEISKWFDNVNALDSVNIHIKKGEITLLIGGNGSGKSTLAKILSGDIYPTSGEIIINDEPYGHLDHKKSLSLGINEVYQDFSLDEQRNIFENIFMGQEINYPLGFLNKRAMIYKTLKLYEQIGVNPPNLKTKVKNLSGGQRQIVAILKVLLRETSLIIFDEPTSSLGVEESKQVEEVIKNLNSTGITILVISHDINQIYRLADNIVELRNGKLIAEHNITDYKKISKGGVYEKKFYKI